MKDFYGYINIDYPAQIAEAERLYNKQAQEAKDANALAELAEKGLFELIKNYTTRYDYNVGIVGEAIEELHGNGETESKKCFSYLRNFILHDFFDCDGETDDIKITDVLWFGGYNEYIEVYFEYNDTTYYISIPIKAHLSAGKRNYYDGKFYVTREDKENEYTRLYGSYSIDDLKKYICKEILGEN